MLLAKIFIKDHTNTTSPSVRAKYGLLSGICGIILNMVLTVLKFIVGTITGSVAITADAFNNLTDCLTSILTIVGFKLSAKPADREHPFGHSRIEYVISLAVAGIILLTGYEVIRSSIAMIIARYPVYFYTAAVIVLIFGMIVKLWMYQFNKKLGQAIKSETLLAVGIDSRNDVIITAVTLISLVFSRFFDFTIDGYIGVLIALIFLRSGYGVAKEALDKIIGNPTDGTLASEIKEIVKSYDGILNAHDLVVHSYGPGRNMASLHVGVAADMSLVDSHDIVEKAANEVLEKLNIELAVHVDPIDMSDQRLQGMINLAQDFLQTQHPTLQAHEFRIVNSVPRPIFVFDMEIPHSNKKKANSIRDAVAYELKNLMPDYDYEINIEHGYVE